MRYKGSDALKRQPLYERWRSVVRRCYAPKHKDYPRYGGRGIGMCEQWRTSYWTFAAHMLPTYQPGMTLERIDNDGDYTPENCRWATYREQRRNQRNNVIVSSPWGAVNLAEAAERSGINYYTLWSRFEKGQPLFAPLMQKPQGKRPRIFVDTPWGPLSMREIAERTEIPIATIKWRLKNKRKLF